MSTLVGEAEEDLEAEVEAAGSGRQEGEGVEVREAWGVVGMLMVDRKSCRLAVLSSFMD
jgi:hypothetical protein